MSMAGLGPVWVLWHLPYHTVVNMRNNYLLAIAPPSEEPDEDVEEIEVAPGLTLERSKKGEPV